MVLKCPRCNENKDESKFPKSRGKGITSRPRMCTQCKKQAFEATHPNHWRSSRDPEKHRLAQQKYAQGEAFRRRNYKERYGVELEEVEAQIEFQDRLCAICKIEQATHLDHDHDTSKPRGFLCHGCNVGIGLLKENIHTLEGAIKYLQTDGVWQALGK